MSDSEGETLHYKDYFSDLSLHEMSGLDEDQISDDDQLSDEKEVESSEVINFLIFL